MKKTMFIACLLVTFVAGSSYADQVCGLLQSHEERPVCNTGELCPAFMTIVYTVTPTDGTPVTVDAPDFSTLESLEAMDGTNVCVNGTADVNSDFVISSISAH
jgi:hypothetical protein